MKQQRKLFLSFIVCVSFVMAACQKSAQKAPDSPGTKSKPHIVVFISDDHGYFDSGCYGNDIVKTPNLDKLAASSMKFTMAFADSPLCMPSRSSIHTGVLPLKNGAAHFGVPVHEGTKMLPDYMKQLGYHTALIGKDHFKIVIGDNKKGKLSYDDMNRAGGQQLKVSGITGKAAADYIKQYNKNKPLFLMVCTYPPHLPWVPNKDYDEKKVDLPPSFVDTGVTRKERAMYYQDVTLMDNMLGEVQTALKEKGMSDNTVFVYTSDHGANWPFGKWCVYDAGLRVPFMVSWPGQITQSSSCDAIIQLTDITPTVIEIAGGKAPNNIDGKSILPLLKGASTTHRKFAFGSHSSTGQGSLSNKSPARTIRTAKYRYILNLDHEVKFHNHITGTKGGIWHMNTWNSWKKAAETDSWAKARVQAYLHRPKEELYDMESDPHSLMNLATSPEHEKILKDMREQLKKQCTLIDDTKALDKLNK